LSPGRIVRTHALDPDVVGTAAVTLIDTGVVRAREFRGRKPGDDSVRTRGSGRGDREPRGDRRGDCEGSKLVHDVSCR
jgi:hypothetical protein